MRIQTDCRDTALVELIDEIEGNYLLIMNYLEHRNTRKRTNKDVTFISLRGSNTLRFGCARANMYLDGIMNIADSCLPLFCWSLSLVQSSPPRYSWGCFYSTKADYSFPRFQLNTEVIGVGVMTMT